jgi:uncharacterized protein (TIGR00255 family)
LLLSMTGFGEARCQQDNLAVTVEVRTINSRFFKLAVRANEGYGSLEPRVEALVRNSIRRGTIQVNVRIERAQSPDAYKINVETLQRYRRQIEAIQRQANLSETVSLETLLLLPGVVDDQSIGGFDASEDWPIVSRTVQTALENLSRMRIDEGRAMADDLKANCLAIAAGLAEIEKRAPQVVEAYRQRLEERLKKILAEFHLELDKSDLVKEVSLMADRGDISEEIVRLRSHLEQFDAIMGLPESAGRKLEFLTQEMFREANTIGSKANDVEIARHVIETKTAIERIREMIQNVE